MSLVHNFSLLSEVYADTRLPLQYPGNGAAAAPRQITLVTLLAWLQANLDLPDSGVSEATVTTGAPSVAIAAGRLVEKIVVVGSTSGTFNLGTSAGGTQILEAENYDGGGHVYAFDKYFLSAGSLFFSGFSGTLTVKIYSR